MLFWLFVGFAGGVYVGFAFSQKLAAFKASLKAKYPLLSWL